MWRQWTADMMSTVEKEILFTITKRDGKGVLVATLAYLNAVKLIN